MAVVRLAAFMLAAALAVQGQSPGELYVLARQAEKKGEFAKAYLYYAQAAAADPQRREYWSRAQSIQTKALTESPPKPKPASAEEAGCALHALRLIVEPDFIRAVRCEGATPRPSATGLSAGQCPRAATPR